MQDKVWKSSMYTHVLIICDEREKFTILNETDTGHMTTELVLRRWI